MTQIIKTHCPQCGFFLDPISNHFDLLFKGIGHRGSSFCDSDWIAHDMATDRVLLMEFKRNGETLSTGQEILLKGLAEIPSVTVWAIWERNDGQFRVAKYPVKTESIMTADELKTTYRRWWNNYGAREQMKSLNNYKLLHLIELCTALRLSQCGNLALGLKPNNDNAARLNTALDFFLSAYNHREGEY